MKKLIIVLVVLGSCTKIPRPSVAWKIPKEYCLATNNYGMYRIRDTTGAYLGRGIATFISSNPFIWSFSQPSIVYNFKDSLTAKEALMSYLQDNSPFECIK